MFDTIIELGDDAKFEGFLKNNGPDAFIVPSGGIDIAFHVGDSGLTTVPHGILADTTFMEDFGGVAVIASQDSIFIQIDVPVTESMFLRTSSDIVVVVWPTGIPDDLDTTNHFHLEDVFLEDFPTSIETDWSRWISIHPNPTQEYIEVKIAEPVRFSLELWNIEGERLYVQEVLPNVQNVRLNLKQIGVGVGTYTLIARKDDYELLTKKVVIH